MAVAIGSGSTHTGLVDRMDESAAGKKRGKKNPEIVEQTNKNQIPKGVSMQFFCIVRHERGDDKKERKRERERERVGQRKNALLS